LLHRHPDRHRVRGPNIGGSLPECYGQGVFVNARSVLLLERHAPRMNADNRATSLVRCLPLCLRARRRGRLRDDRRDRRGRQARMAMSQHVLHESLGTSRDILTGRAVAIGLVIAVFDLKAGFHQPWVLEILPVLIMFFASKGRLTFPLLMLAAQLGAMLVVQAHIKSGATITTLSSAKS
jgi:hypothetical protein